MKYVVCLTYGTMPLQLVNQTLLLTGTRGKEFFYQLSLTYHAQINQVSLIISQISSSWNHKELFLKVM